jgi:thiol-disulfide isomerase/thioredoxin
MFKLISILLLSTLFYSIQGQTRSIHDVPIADLQKRVETASDTIYVVNFWATWCQPCVKEIPEFNKIPSSYRQKPVKVIMANLDFANQKESRVVPFLQNNTVVHEVIMAITPRGGEWIDKMDKAWSGAIPATIVLHNGQRYFHEGETHYEEIIGWIDSLL